MSDSDGSDILWNFFTGIIIGWIIFGIFRLAWMLMKGIWWVIRYFYGVISGHRQSRRIATFQQAEALEAEGRLEEAAEAYRVLAGTSDPGVAGMAAYSLGSLLEQAEEWDEAAAMYRRAIASQNSEVVPLATLGLGDTLYFGQGDSKAAEPIYRHLLRPSSQTIDALADRMSFLFIGTGSLIHLLYDRGDYEEAQALCRNLAENRSFSSSDRIGASVCLARILAKQGKVEEAMELLNRSQRTADADDRAALPRFRRPLFRAESLEVVMGEICPPRGVARPLGHSA